MSRYIRSVRHLRASRALNSEPNVYKLSLQMPIRQRNIPTWNLRDHQVVRYPKSVETIKRTGKICTEQSRYPNARLQHNQEAQI